MPAEVIAPKYPIFDSIEIPEKVLKNWQVTVDILSRIANIPAALIMRAHADKIEVLIKSDSEGNVYHQGEKTPLNSNLYCETVMDTQRELLVPNALKDHLWNKNPDIALGMISYCGLPVTWPKGKLFGTICILDNHENAYSTLIRELLARFRDSIQFDLNNIYNSYVERKAREAAEDATRAKSAFLANMSHELRSPLNAILGFSELMSMDETITAKQKEMLDIINSSGAHLLNMINNVLDISQIEAGHLELHNQPCNLKQLLLDAGEMISFRIIKKKQLRFALEIAKDVPSFILIDDIKLRQVVINLLDNATKFTKPGGTVVLRAHSEPSPATMSMLIIEVIDSGVGIPTDMLENLFKPFVQLKQENSNTKGTGLGLAISKSLVELMGGQITVNSTLGKGSTFKIELPVSLVDTAEIEVKKKLQPAKSIEPHHQGWRLLVVDDDADSRLLLSTLLLGAGFQVHEPENGQKAIAVFKQWQPHLIWMDSNMPVMDGYEATSKIRQLAGGDKVKILALTASVSVEDYPQFINAGCDEVLSKPFHASEILNALTRHLGIKFR